MSNEDILSEPSCSPTSPNDRDLSNLIQMTLATLVCFSVLSCILTNTQWPFKKKSSETNSWIQGLIHALLVLFSFRMSTSISHQSASSLVCFLGLPLGYMCFELGYIAYTTWDTMRNGHKVHLIKQLEFIIHHFCVIWFIVVSVGIYTEQTFSRILWLLTLYELSTVLLSLRFIFRDLQYRSLCVYMQNCFFLTFVTCRIILGTYYLWIWFIQPSFYSVGFKTPIILFQSLNFWWLFKLLRILYSKLSQNTNTTEEKKNKKKNE